MMFVWVFTSISYVYPQGTRYIWYNTVDTIIIEHLLLAVFSTNT